MSKPTKKQKNTNFTTAAKPAPTQAAAPQIIAAPKPAQVATTPSPVSTAAPQPPPKAEPARALPVTATPATATTGSKQGHVMLELVNPAAKNVFVAGSFNGWKPESTPLKPAGGGRWVGDLSVKPGRHEYLFVVDGQWLPDPNAKEAVQNPFGGTNSVLIVSE